ncbi:MAG TPA: hypothetical protein VJ819_15340 [Nocardioidaceae bacterium]|nr:hypothetical protein [Nocardioidaceae bacterium]
MTGPAHDPFLAALTQELGKKTGVCWLRYDGQEHAAWHIWLDDALYLVSGGAEQPLPGIEDASSVEVVMRSKENGGRLLTWVAAASVVHPTDELWQPVTAALVSARLNLDDLSTAAADWAEHSVVTRLAPTATVVESPGALSDASHRAEPGPTRATTRGPLPKVFHRRMKRRPKLS